MRDYLERLLAGNLPSATGIRVENLAEIEGGWETDIYRFDLAYRQSGESHSTELVARFYAGPRGADRAIREAAVLRAIARAGIPVPEVEFESVEASQHGTAVVVMERVSGQVLANTLGSDELIAQMARSLAAVHRLPVTEVFGGQSQPFAEPGFVPPDVASMAAAVDRHGLAEFRPVIDWLTASGPVEHEPCVLHNDYHADNIIVRDRDGGLVIIDWSFAAAGDYRLDLAWTALWTGAAGGSDSRTKLLAAYEEAANNAVTDLEYFEALKLGSRLLTVSSWLTGSVAPPVAKITRSAIRTDYKPTLMTVYERFHEVTGIPIPLLENL